MKIEKLNPDCIFCKIIKGEIPCSKIYEDEKTLVFLDIQPVHKGHCLIIPKEHSENILDTKDKYLHSMISTSKKIAKAMMEATHADGFNININTKKAAGQLVDHVHFHIIPRFKEDGLKLWPQSPYQEGKMQEIADKIKSLL